MSHNLCTACSLKLTECLQKGRVRVPGAAVLRADRRLDVPGTNCIKIGLLGKPILSKRKGLWEVRFSLKYYLRINFPGRPIFIRLPPADQGAVVAGRRPLRRLLHRHSPGIHLALSGR